MPRTTIPYRAAPQQSPVGTDVPSPRQSGAAAALRADLVCWSCSQRIVPYPDAADAGPSFCLWPCEPPKQSHGLCRDCEREYRAARGTLTEWMLRRREHMARVPGLLRELLALRYGASGRGRERGGA